MLAKPQYKLLLKIKLRFINLKDTKIKRFLLKTILSYIISFIIYFFMILLDLLNTLHLFYLFLDEIRSKF